MNPQAYTQTHTLAAAQSSVRPAPAYMHRQQPANDSPPPAPTHHKCAPKDYIHAHLPSSPGCQANLHTCTKKGSSP